MKRARCLVVPGDEEGRQKNFDEKDLSDVKQDSSVFVRVEKRLAIDQRRANQR